jgi:hypothetical protein
MSPRATTAVLAAVGCVALLAIAGSAAGGGNAGKPASASAAAFALRDENGVATDSIRVRRNGTKKGAGTYVTAATRNDLGRAVAKASTKRVAMFGDLVTAKRVTVTARAGQGKTVTAGVAVGLVVAGQSIGTVSKPRTIPMGGYGRLLVLRGRQGTIEGLRATLTKDYKGYPAGSTMIAAYAEATATDGVAPPPPKPKPPKTTPQPPPKTTPRPAPPKPHKATKPPRRKGPSRKEVLATDKHFVFPVYGKHDLADGFTGAGTGQLKPGCVGPHAGDDIFANIGTPILAVADGRLEQVGTLPCSGNRVWLRSTRGDRFFYAHLESFASITQDGARVKAGEVIGFVGNTGQAELRPSHLHFEIHPGGGLAVDPYPFLRAWESHRDVPAAAWVRRYSADVGQQPGTLVVLKDFLSR